VIIPVEDVENMWCPMARPATVQTRSTGLKEPEPAEIMVAVVANRDDEDEDLSSRCYGPNCMMWRWANGAEKAGYCGLAGKPFGAP
jgi:hypothetical protein